MEIPIYIKAARALFRVSRDRETFLVEIEGQDGQQKFSSLPRTCLTYSTN